MVVVIVYLLLKGKREKPQRHSNALELHIRVALVPFVKYLPDLTLLGDRK